MKELLFYIFVSVATIAIVLAISAGILYLIWNSNMPIWLKVMLSR